MIACPSCKRRVITRRDMLYANLDGEAQCRICGRFARLDLMSRWTISCVLALAMLPAFLYGGVFYSGHLFVISIFFGLGGWRILSAAGLPIFALEAVPSRSSINGRQSILLLVLLLMVAIVIDGFMSSRIEADGAPQTENSPRGASAAAQRLDDDHLVGRGERLRQVARLPAVDEDADVAPYAVLLVDHAETNPGIATVEVGEDGAERGAARLGLALLGV
jgi:hypothetical protein